MREVKDISKSIIFNKKGDISWLLSQVALLIAVGILLASVASLAFYSDWRKKAEINVIASQLARTIEAMEIKEFPERIEYLPPEKNYVYDIFISTEYVTVKRYDGKISKEIMVKKELHIRPWINPPMSDEKGAEGIYKYFGSIYGSHRNGASPSTKLPSGVLEGEIETMTKELAINPFKINCKKPLYIERISIYVEGENAESIVIIYQ